MMRLQFQKSPSGCWVDGAGQRQETQNRAPQASSRREVLAAEARVEAGRCAEGQLALHPAQCLSPGS